MFFRGERGEEFEVGVGAGGIGEVGEGLKVPKRA